MKMKKLILVILLLFLATGCAVYTPAPYYYGGPTVLQPLPISPHITADRYPYRSIMAQILPELIYGIAH